MVSLMKKVFMPLLITGLSFLPSQAVSQEKDSTFTSRSSVSAAFGGYFNGGEDFRDEYGTLLGGRVDATFEINKNFRITGDIGIFSKEKSSTIYNEGVYETSKDEISFFNFSAMIQYSSNFHKDISGYFGAGLTYSQVKSGSDGEYYTGSSTGFVLGSGSEFDIGDNLKLFIETWYRSLSSDEIKTDGLEAFIGIRKYLSN